jgi:hypothetical protein
MYWTVFLLVLLLGQWLPAWGQSAVPLPNDQARLRLDTGMRDGIIDDLQQDTLFLKPSGTPPHTGQMMTLEINASQPRALTWDTGITTEFGQALPTQTAAPDASGRPVSLLVLLRYRALTDTWGCVASTARPSLTPGAPVQGAQ